MKYDLSSNSTITTSDTLIATRTLPPIAFGDPSPCVVPDDYAADVVIPSGTALGYYYLGAIIDPSNAIAETNEDNNVATWAVKVQ